MSINLYMSENIAIFWGKKKNKSAKAKIKLINYCGSYIQ